MINTYYIYAHIRPDKNEIFYIGKGKGRRATTRDKRNKIWNDIVIKNNGVFQIIYLHKNLTELEAFEFEIKYISEKGRLCNNSGCLANLTLGGEGTSGHILSDKHKQKISNALSGKNHPLFGKKHSIEHSMNMSKSLKGKKPWNKGKTHTEGAKEKIRLKALGRPGAQKGKKMSILTKEKLSLLRKGKPTSQSKHVINILTNKIIASSAVEFYNSVDCKNRSLIAIHAYLNGNRKKPEWFHYEYKR